MTDHQIEQEIQAKGLTAPRITPVNWDYFPRLPRARRPLIEARDNPYKQLIPDGNPREGWELSKRSVRWSQGLGKLLIDGDAFIIEGPPAWALASIIIGMRKEILRLRSKPTSPPAPPTRSDSMW